MTPVQKTLISKSKIKVIILIILLIFYKQYLNTLTGVLYIFSDGKYLQYW